MIPPKAFFTVHRDLPREGPGLPGDVIWALDVAATPETARILDAACGPGADTVTMAEAKPKARIDAIDRQPHFIDAATARTSRFGDRVHASVGDYTALPATYDLIWCAGAVYFIGLEAALKTWRAHLVPGGAVAFSEPAWVSNTPSFAARSFWAEYPAIASVSQLESRIADAGWQVVGQRWVIGAGWKAYYAPMKARLETLRVSHPDPDADLRAAIDEHEREIAGWEATPDEIAYSLFVVRPA